MRIEDVVKVYEKHPLLRVPKHVYILEVPLIYPQELVLIKGANPVGSDTIILTPQADEETIIHETLHTYGFGEIAVSILVPIITRVVRMRRRKIRFREVPVSKEELAMFGIRSYPPNMPINAKHYILEEVIE